MYGLIINYNLFTIMESFFSTLSLHSTQYRWPYFINVFSFSVRRYLSRMLEQGIKEVTLWIPSRLNLLYQIFWYINYWSLLSRGRAMEARRRSRTQCDDLIESVFSPGRPFIQSSKCLIHLNNLLIHTFFSSHRSFTLALILRGVLRAMTRGRQQ